MADLIPRGIRNNNPLNIRHSKNSWQGQSAKQEDDSFVTFTTPVMGIRAAMKTLQTYYNKYNLWSVWEIIRRYAPPNENKTDIYALNVAAHMGVGVNDEINIITDPQMMIKMIQAMILQENGHSENYPNWIYKNEPFWYDEDVYQSAWNSLGGKQRGN